jgi:hypothetical protein
VLVGDPRRVLGLAAFDARMRDVREDFRHIA